MDDVRLELTTSSKLLDAKDARYQLRQTPWSDVDFCDQKPSSGGWLAIVKYIPCN